MLICVLIDLINKFELFEEVVHKFSKIFALKAQQ